MQLCTFLELWAVKRYNYKLDAITDVFSRPDGDNQKARQMERAHISEPEEGACVIELG